ncbi:hypothetical protein N1851_001457 [Merluccius polli]|uniref:Uncharacterized protein n=1 Tax=Merluccius polli TaxID=89951 RepID=A0AA47PBM7_MERPO|nr:hypothetical protein N1851_001457 [Merluccius polli]
MVGGILGAMIVLIVLVIFGHHKNNTEKSTPERMLCSVNAVMSLCPSPTVKTLLFLWRVYVECVLLMAGLQPHLA